MYLGVEEAIIVGDVTIEFLLSKDGALRAHLQQRNVQYFGDSWDIHRTLSYIR